MKRIGNTPKPVIVLFLLASVVTVCFGLVKKHQARENSVHVTKIFSTMPCKQVLSTFDTGGVSFTRFQQCAK